MIVVFCGLVTGCSSYTDKTDSSLFSFWKKDTEIIKSHDESVHDPDKHSDDKAIHHYVERLAEQFFLTTEQIDINKTVAIGTFLPISQLNGNALPTVDPIAHQIQESFITIAAQVGLNVIEFKTMTHIKIKNNQDLMLSRQIDELNTNIQADYFLTGNYIEHKSQLVVNARLIELPSRRVIAAATDYIPKEVMSTTSAVTLKNNQLYRGVN